jgi:hypothetical protein
VVLGSDPNPIGKRAPRAFACFAASSVLYTPSMDSPLVNRIFRRLFAHDTCSQLRTIGSRSPPSQAIAQCPHRTLSVTARQEERNKKYGVKPNEQASWQQRTSLLVDNKLDEFKRYPTVTADDLRSRKQRPRRVKMLLRDFIEGLLTQLANFSVMLILSR